MSDKFNIKFSDEKNILGLLELGDDSNLDYATFTLEDVMRLFAVVTSFNDEVDIGIATQHTKLLIARPHTKDSNLWFGLAEYKTD